MRERKGEDGRWRQRETERDRRREEGERERVAQYRDPAISLMNMDSHFLFFCFNYSINIYKELKAFTVDWNAKRYILGEENEKNSRPFTIKD